MTKRPAGAATRGGQKVEECDSMMLLGAEMTGLAAGMVADAPIFEAIDQPGGICSSYYVRPGETRQLPMTPEDGRAYRFEIGGGHWNFGGDPAVLRFKCSPVPMNAYARRSSVYFSRQGR